MRQVLNSVYLAEAIQMGLDSCIVHHRKILPINRISDDILKITLDLIYDRRTPEYDPLFKLIERLEGENVGGDSEAVSDDGPI